MGGRARRRIAREAKEAADAQIKAYREEQAIQRKIFPLYSSSVYQMHR